MSISGTSPVTGVIEEHQVILDFGIHAGKTVKDIAEVDPEFYGRLAADKDTGIYAIRRHKDKSFRLYRNPLSGADN